MSSCLVLGNLRDTFALQSALVPATGLCYRRGFALQPSKQVMLYVRLVEDNSRVLATRDLRYRQQGNEAKQPLESHGNKTKGK